MLSSFFPKFVVKAKPFITTLSLFDTCACVGASLAANAVAVHSRLGLLVLIPVSIFRVWGA